MTTGQRNQLRKLGYSVTREQTLSEQWWRVVAPGFGVVVNDGDNAAAQSVLDSHGKRAAAMAAWKPPKVTSDDMELPEYKPSSDDDA